MLKAGIAFLVGTSALLLFTEIPSLLTLLPILALIAFLGYTKKSLFSLLALSGFAYAIVFAHLQMSHRLPAEYQGQAIYLEGEVISIPSKDKWRQSFYFKVHKAQVNNHDLAIKKIRLSWYKTNVDVQLGQHWQVMAKLKQPHGSHNQAGFNYETWLWVNKIDATGSVISSEKYELLAKPVKPLRRLRNYYSQHLDSLLKENEYMSFYKALSIGDKTQLDVKDREYLQKTGTAHLFAISGLHIGLASMFFWYLAYGLWLGLSFIFKERIQAIPRPVFCACLSLLGAIFYAALAGFSVPTIRALLVLTAFLLGIIFYRSVNWSYSFGLALLLTLIFQPASLLDISFCLSFLAVFIIAYAMSGRIGLRSTKMTNLLMFLKIQLLISLLLMPVLLYFFGQAALLGALANVLAVPFASLLLVPAILIMVLLLPFASYSFIDACLHKVLAFLDLLFSLFWKLIHYFASWQWSKFEFHLQNEFILALLLVAVFILFLPKAFKQRYWVLLVLLPVVIPQTKPVQPGEFSVDVMDVGQGLAVLVSTENHQVLFDAGPAYPPKFDAGKDIVIPVLRNKRISRLDKLMISHADIDHRGGMRALLNANMVDELQSNIATYYLDDYRDKLDISPCTRGQSWQWDGVLFEVLHPPDYWFTQDNNSSCVLRVSNNELSVLIPGDIEWLAEFELLDHSQQKKLNFQSDVLLSPHHGSRSSSTIPFVKAVDPSLVIHSAGYQNRFKLPNEEVGKRYKKLGIRQLNTANTGQVSINSVLWPDKTSINTLRTSKKRFWYWRPAE